MKSARERLNEFERTGINPKESKPKCIIVDLEGTLSDHSHRVYYLKKKDYGNYNLLFKSDPVNKNLIYILNEYINSSSTANYAVILCTAKSEIYKKEVIDWLKRNKINNYICAIFFREELDSRPSVLVKADQLKLIKKEYDVVCAYDDRPDNVDMYRKNGVKAFLVKTAPLPKLFTPDKVLEFAAKIFKEKNKEYGDAYLRHGKIMSDFFPDGIRLKTESDFFKFHMFSMDIMKSNRIASNLVLQKNHSDSWLDKMVFSSMVKGEK